MRLVNMSWCVACFVLAVLAGGLRAHAAAEPAAASTLANLQTAYNGESNAHARYTEFAAAAQREGYLQVAALFRAAARAESIHAANHAKAIAALGAEPANRIDPVDVKSTEENLKAAIAGETYERDTMYPAFLKQARAEGQRDAVRSLNFALAAEGQHARLYQAALDNLAQAKEAAVYYVCPVCGATELARPDSKCAVCFTSKEKFERID